MEVVTADTVQEHTSADEAHGPVSILDKIRAAGENARRNRTFVMELPREHAGEGLGLRLGLPTEAVFTFSDDVAFLANNLNRQVADELTFLAHNIRSVVTFEDGEWVDVPNVSVQQLAAGYASSLTGGDVPVSTDEDAMRWLYSIGTPPQVNAQVASVAAKSYRLWAYHGDQDDPTVGL